jgi:glycosyltransferase involved in cell wall biosynthesis
VNPDLYQPVPFEKKDVDIFMLANFGKYKRHHRLFAALRQLPRTVRVLLIGQRNAARTAETILQEARAYGVADRFELKQNAPEEEVLHGFARAKISLILSRREGSCVAVVESLFANTPIGLYADAEVGSRQFINEHTGRFLQHDQLVEQLLDFLANAQHYRPRQWALDHQISCYGSAQVLNRIVKETSLAAGHEWTVDLAPFHWRPDPRLIQEADRLRMRASYEDIQQRYGITLGLEQFR